VASLKILASVLIALSLSQCATLNPDLRKLESQPAVSVINYKDLTTGTWEGWLDHKPLMRLTFNEDSTMTVEYLSYGGKFTVPYKLKNEGIIETSHFPENLIITKHTDDEFSFRPEGNRLRKDINVIYVCRFVRPMK
jgi:hypothetical protein